MPIDMNDPNIDPNAIEPPTLAKPRVSREEVAERVHAEAKALNQAIADAYSYGLEVGVDVFLGIEYPRASRAAYGLQRTTPPEIGVRVTVAL